MANLFEQACEYETEDGYACESQRRAVVLVRDPVDKQYHAWCDRCLAVYGRVSSVKARDFQPVGTTETNFSDFTRAENILRNAGTDRCLCRYFNCECHPCFDAAEERYWEAR